MDYMKSSDKFRTELSIRVFRIGIKLKQFNNIAEMLENGAPYWIYKDLIDDLLTTLSADHEWICQNQALLLLYCPETWLKHYPEVLKFRKVLKELGY